MKLMLMLLVALILGGATAPEADARTDVRPWKAAMVRYWKAEHVKGKMPRVGVKSNKWGRAARRAALRIEQHDRLHTPTVVVFDGNSLTNAYWDDCAAMLPARFACHNAAVGGQGISAMIERGPAYVDTHLSEPGRHILVMWPGTIALMGGRPADYIHSRFVEYARARRAAGWTVVTMTVLPLRWHDRTDIEPNRQALNRIIRREWQTYADRLVDIAADAMLGDQAAVYDPTRYRDGVHLTARWDAHVARYVAAHLRRMPERPSGRFDAGLRALLRPYRR